MELQICGHPTSYIVSSDEGTHYCKYCEHLAKWQAIIDRHKLPDITPSRETEEDARWRELDKLSQEGGWTPWNWEQR